MQSVRGHGQGQKGNGDDAEGKDGSVHRWQEGRDGLYRSLVFGDASLDRQVKVILLDTRSHRGIHAIPSAGSYLAW